MDCVAAGVVEAVVDDALVARLRQIPFNPLNINSGPFAFLVEWHDGDIIMVGSSRLSAPRRLFLGSTAAKMLRVLDVPMVVVPRDQVGDEDPA